MIWLDKEVKMDDMKKIFEEVGVNLEKFSEKFPEKMESFKKMMEAIETPKALDKKQKELMAVSLSISNHCKWCIAYHVKKALESGATKDEISEASWMAVLMGGGPALMYMQLVEKAIEDFENNEK